ncbi:diacylglycerol/lipid kinase family protein [Sphingomonas hankyongi]|uniref:YegS/Rv2252/BmrU family lipid kinase n=1 Tax=Sphingomonas hankyongi TaxID=2908209 RepID=A0ABT0S1I2_9SPHN|nr:YegS/Rv2252/BmrU family lipid kinase [Sphingomonas hankyongi]MCL6729596.1 YegS/Rv2252/BmrU family lipid kinase [Sphingomonas hankyongi]
MATELPKNAILIVNTASRSGAETFDPACEKLTAAGVHLIDARAVDDPAAMSGEVRAAVDRAPMVIVGGGDGSLSETVDHFLGRDTVFGLLPLGTANSFARTLGIPLDLDGAVEVIASGEARRIDLAAIDGAYFLNNAALGLAPVVAESVPSALKRSLGRLGYLLWAGWSAASFKAFRLRVHDGHVMHRLWATEARIANGRFHGGIELIENADLESGEIVVQVVSGRSLVKLGWSYLASAVKAPSRHEAVREFHGERMRIETRPRMRVSIDGELGPETPFEAWAVPDAVTVAAPRS